MELRQLETLAAVADRGSFSAAAEALGISQPAVSQQIQTLERDIGSPLIDRSGRRARLTERGEVVLRHARRLLAARDELARELADQDGELAGHLVVGSSTGLGEHVLPPLLGGFRELHPAVSVTLRVEVTVTVIDRVLERELELGVVGATRANRALVYEPFLEDRIVLAVPAGHRFAGRTIGLDDLVAEPLIVMQAGAGVRTVIEDELRRAGVRARDLRIAMEMGLQESAKAAVEAGYGVSFLSSLALDRELRLGTLATAEVDGIDPVREFSTVRPAHTPPAGWSRRSSPTAATRSACQAGAAARRARPPRPGESPARPRPSGHARPAAGANRHGSTRPGGAGCRPCRCHLTDRWAPAKPRALVLRTCSSRNSIGETRSKRDPGMGNRTYREGVKTGGRHATSTGSSRRQTA